MWSQKLIEFRNSPRGLWVAGVLSGTSADGIDVALARFQGEASPECHFFRTVDFPSDLGIQVRSLLEGARIDLGGLTRLHQRLGHTFGVAARVLANERGLPLDLVGSHGQTVWHFDGVLEPATLQLGEGNALAEAAGAPCVHDFRCADVAVGGHGAPLAIHADVRLFGKLERPLGVLNLGGMGNLSVLPGPSGKPMSFDTGPAGALLDGLARRLWGAPMDRDGAWASQGTVHEDWVTYLLSHPFFGEVPPRSTGRDTFGEAFLDRYIERLGTDFRPEDALASAVCAVARSVALALERFVDPHPKRLVVAGGGVHNRALLAALERETRLRIDSSEAVGIDPDAREALLFACLAVDFVLERAPDWPWVTGARGFPVLGKLALPPLPGPSGPRQLP